MGRLGQFLRQERKTSQILMGGGLHVPAPVTLGQEPGGRLRPVQAQMGGVKDDHALGEGVGGQPVVGLRLDGPQVGEGDPGGPGDILEALVLLLAQLAETITERTLRLGFGDRGGVNGHGFWSRSDGAGGGAGRQRIRVFGCRRDAAGRGS
jgi:hypothetical protein